MNVQSDSRIHADASKLGLPLVVQVGFAGSRRLVDPDTHQAIDIAAFEVAVTEKLTEALQQMRCALKLSDRHFCCGLSQLAIGADTCFTRACKVLDWPQRLFLPQQREDFLRGSRATGTPDFTDAQRDPARQLFASSHVIQARVVSDASDRRMRFQDVNLELVRVSDVLVCLVRASATGQAGGTIELVEAARHRKRPVLEIHVSVAADGQPQFGETSHHLNAFVPPALPDALAGVDTALTSVASLDDYCTPLKAFASDESKFKQLLFSRSALAIIGAHLSATLCALVALKLHGAAALPWLLGAELILLLLGFTIHRWLHRTHAVQRWAMVRLVAEVARSCAALRIVPGYMSHLFSLPLPASLRPLLRTLNVLHLRETRSVTTASWQARRDEYLHTRLIDPLGGQIPYYSIELQRAENRAMWANVCFNSAATFAMIATATKLLLVTHVLSSGPIDPTVLEATLGALAVVLPVVAVGALSLAASFDLEARAYTYREMLEFLHSRQQHLASAQNDRAFNSLAMETEARLVAETANWYSRRAFTGVT